MEPDVTIVQKLRTIVAKSLQIPENKVRLNSTLMLELEAESIDILDIKFAIEQEFGFKFDEGEIKTMLVKAASEHKLTEKDIPALFTVERLYDYIVHKLKLKHGTGG